MTTSAERAIREPDLAPGYSMFPLSQEQHRLWLVHEVTPETTAYHVPAALRLRGPLDVPALRAALDALVARHETLRTTIRCLDGVPHQHITDTARADFALVDVPDGTDPAEHLLRDAYEPFDLARGPLLRCRVYRTGPRDHLLLVCAHHIVVDAWSLRLLIAELRTLYRGGPAAPPPESLQYADFVAWQREQPADADEPALAYWRRQLSGAPAHFSLADGAVAPVPATAAPAATVCAEIDARTGAAVRGLAAELGTTPMAVLLAVWSLVLARHLGRPDVAVLVPVANRDLPETELLVGFFVNTLVLRLEPGPAATFAELLHQVHERCTAAYAHQTVAFERLVDELRPDRELGRTPFSDVLFAYEDQIEDVTLDGLAVSVVPVPPRNAKCELALEVSPAGDGFRVRADYRTDRLDRARIAALVESFVATVSRSVTDVRRPIGGPVAEPTVPTSPAPAGFVAPGDPLEERLRDLVCETIGVPAARVGVHDDFFALGGNSLLAGRFVARLGAEGLALRTFLERPTVAGLADWLTRQAGVAPAPALTPAARPEPGGEPWLVPASFSQERLWFLDQLTPGNAAYHVPVVLRVDGEVDLPALERALARLTARHEVLRTSFGLRDGALVQHVLAAVRVPARHVDLSAAPPDERRLADFVAAESSRPFDLTCAPLLRLLTARLGHAEHLLVLTMHHLACDALSARVLVRDIGALYLAETGGPEPDLPELPVQYADFAGWQRDQLSGSRLGELTEFWRSALAGAPAVLELPTDRPRPAVPAHRGADVRFELPDALLRGIHRLATAHRMTSFMVLLAGLGLTLCRYAGQREVLVGTPVANRTRAEFDELMGFFANTVALRVDTSGGPVVAELLDRVRETCLAAYAHQDLPFEKVVEAVAPAREHAANPLFQVMLAVEDAPVSVELPGLRVSRVEQDASIGKFDLTVVVEDLRTGAAVARYDTDLFDGTTVRRLVAHLVRVLEQLVAAPHRRVAELDLLSADERSRQLEHWNDAPAHYPVDVPLHELVGRQVAATPDAVALSGCLDCNADEPCAAAPGHLTYGELGARAAAVATALADLGTRRGDVVGVLLGRSAGLVVAELGVLEAGAAFLPLEPSHPALRTAAILADGGCRVVVTSSRHADRVPPGTAVVLVDRLPGSPRKPGSAGGKDLAYVVYTSGSTGGPKGALIEHAGIVNNLRWMQQDWPLGRDDRLLFKTVHTFDVSVKEIFWPLIAGAQVVIAHPGAERDAHEICVHLARSEATVVHLVPSMLDVVLEVSRRRGMPLSSLRMLMAGAESLSPATHDEILARLPALLLHMYGPTETAIAVTGWPCRDAVGTGRLALGRAMPNARLYVLDERLRPVPQGCLGELYVGGLPVGRGYLARPAETAAAFLADPFAHEPGARMYRTGDLVRYRNDELLEFRGRRDSQVKIRGLRIEPGEVAGVLARHPDVRQATVIPWPRSRPVSLVAYVVGELSPTSVRAFLRERLPAYLVPTHVEVLPALPTGANGKVDHARLPAPAATGTERPADREPPRTPVERRLAEIWGELLEVPDVGRHDNFFDVGGHSLLATRLAARLLDEFGAEIPLRALFAQPTVAALATMVDAARTGRGNRIPVVERTAYRLPDFPSGERRAH
ncbi:amino acid adenylation domain-containing protein [Actinophytocola sp.]|uniref:amino acid adenylation domain-containing protein n=1 Tax=Actinophytocola sp. TaxID=1872138 RepID=UPI002ED8297C